MNDDKKPNRVLSVAILVIPTLLLVFICLFSYIYTHVPFPSPKPYPGSQVNESHPIIGMGRRQIEFEYSVDVPIVGLQKYYEEEMKQYCEDEWEFEETENGCADFMNCRVANCEIPRPLVDDAQFFLVYLRSISETQTNVLYIQTTYEP